MVNVWFLVVTITAASGGVGAQKVDVFNTLGECETAAYNMQDYTIEYEKANEAEAELHCIKHTKATI